MAKRVKQRTDEYSLSILRPVLATALALSHRAAQRLLWRIRITIETPEGTESLAVGAPFHKGDLRLALAGRRIDLDIAVRVLVRVEVDIHMRVGLVEGGCNINSAPVGELAGYGDFSGQGGGEGEEDGEESEEGFHGDHIGIDEVGLKSVGKLTCVELMKFKGRRKRFALDDLDGCD